jgi:GTPase
MARQDIEEMLGRKVFLELFVKVRENWRESPQFLNQLDWRMSMMDVKAEGAEAAPEAPEAS